MPIDYDSILTATDTNLINQTEFYRVGVNLPDHTVPMVERTYRAGNDDIVVVSMMLMFFVLAFVVYRYRPILSTWLKDCFSDRSQHQEERMSANVGEAVSVAMLIFVCAFSLSFILFNGVLAQSGAHVMSGLPYWLFGAGFVVCVCFIYLKAWLYRLVNWVFFDSDWGQLWLQDYLLLTAVLAFFFYPIALVEVFYPLGHQVVTVTVILVVILYEMLLFYKLQSNFRTKKYGYLLINLYFCSVEALPALVLWHLAMWVSDNVIVKNLIY